MQDPFENLMSVVKGHLLMLVGALVYLYVTQNGVNSSRFVVTLTFALSIVFDFVLRMIIRKMHLRKHPIAQNCRTLEIWPPYGDTAEVIAAFRQGSYDEVLVHQSSKFFGSTENENEKVKFGKIVSALEEEGIRTFIDVNNNDYRVRSGIISDIANFAAIPAFVRTDKFNLFGIKYSVARTEEAVLHVLGHMKELSGHYICFSNVHTTVMGKESTEYREVLNDAAFVFPDGNPIAVLQQKKGYEGAERVAGPDFMEHMFKDTQDGELSHFFYGASQETLDALRDNLLKKYPGISIKGMYSPPYRELSPEEDVKDVEMINSSGADLVWIGLGAPKQERWMRAHQGRINGVMLGVGAGFDFHAGTIKRAPGWIQKIGFEWLYRLFQDPGRLFKRYFVTNGKFFWYLLVNMVSGNN